MPDQGRKSSSSTGLSPQLRLAFPEDRWTRREEEREVRCRGCGKRFAVPRWYAEEGIRLHFCSGECRKAWKRERVEEPFHLRLKGRPEYRGGNWEAQAARARSRDGYRCRVCGITEEELKRRLDVHHLLPVRLFGSAMDANSLSNLTSVCRSCHKRLEEGGRCGFPLFERAKHPGQRPGAQA